MERFSGIMNETEFRQWFNDFRHKFPQHALWAQEQEGFLATWLAVFQRRKVTLADALEANTQMAAGEEEIPRAYERDEIPSRIARLTSPMRMARAEANKDQGAFYDAVRCLRCQDTGNVTIWGRVAVEECTKGREFPRAVAVAACDCQSGVKWKTARRPLRPYSESHHCIYDERKSRSDNEERLREWVARPIGSREFHEWNA